MTTDRLRVTFTPAQIAYDADALANTLPGDVPGRFGDLALLVRDLAAGIVGASAPPEAQPIKPQPIKPQPWSLAYQLNRYPLDTPCICGHDYGGHDSRDICCECECSAFAPTTTRTPHTPRTVPERVLAAGLGEDATPQAVTPADLGIDEIKVEAARGGGWQASWWPIGHDATTRWQHGGHFGTPELAFADAIERVRQSAHAANAQREAAEAVPMDADLAEPDGYYYGP